MTKLTLTIVADDDAAALRVLHRAYKDLDYDHSGSLQEVVILNTPGYTGSWDDGNYTCDVLHFTPATAGEPDITRLARAFTEHVQAIFLEDGSLASNDDFQEILRRNRSEPDPYVCHTLQFCDSHILISNAWEDLFPAETFCPQNPTHQDLFHAAWQKAKNAEFDLQRLPL